MTETETARSSLTLRVAPRSGRAKIIPEEAAAFDIVLRNEGTAPESVLSLEMNQLTPVVRAYGHDGTLLVEGTPLDAEHRVAGESGEPVMRRPRTIDLAPGAEQTTWINLWSYTSPLPPGKYEIEIEHRVPSLLSNRLPFEVITAEVAACAQSYEAATRMATLLAWIATPAGGEPQLYCRLSGFGDHATVQQGGFAFEPVSAAARLAVSQAASPMADWFHWVAVVTGQELRLFRSNMAFLDGRSDPVPLPITDALPVPRFPERKQSVFLATGQKDGKPALVGVPVEKGGPAPVPWTVPLASTVRRAACVFGPTGDITLLLASDDGQASRLSLLVVGEAGNVVSAERVIRSTPHAIAAVVADLRFGAARSFVVFEADRKVHDHVAWYRVPDSGAPLDVPALKSLGGWPFDSGGAAPRPLAARELEMEIDLQGNPGIAVIDERGWLTGGTLPGPLTLLRKDSVSRCAHLAAMSGHPRIAAFTEEGLLFFSGAH